jgi:hypothetical protein
MNSRCWKPFCGLSDPTVATKFGSTSAPSTIFIDKQTYNFMSGRPSRNWQRHWTTTEPSRKHNHPGMYGTSFANCVSLESWNHCVWQIEFHANLFVTWMWMAKARVGRSEQNQFMAYARVHVSVYFSICSCFSQSICNQYFGRMFPLSEWINILMAVISVIWRDYRPWYGGRQQMGIEWVIWDPSSCLNSMTMDTHHQMKSNM